MISGKHCILFIIYFSFYTTKVYSQTTFIKTFKFEHKHRIESSWLGRDNEIIIGTYNEQDSSLGGNQILLILDSLGEIIRDTVYNESPFLISEIKRIPEFGNRLIVCGGSGMTSWLTIFSSDNNILFDSNYNLTGEEFGSISNAFYSKTRNEIFTIGSGRPSIYHNHNDWGILVQRFNANGNRIFKNIIMDTGNYQLPPIFSYFNSASNTYTILSYNVLDPLSLRSVVLDSVGTKISVNTVLDNVHLFGPKISLANDHKLLFHDNSSGFYDTLFAVELSPSGSLVSSKIVSISPVLSHSYKGAGCVLMDSGYLFTYTNDEMIKTDKNFNILWKKPIPAVKEMIVRKSYGTSDGGILLIGTGSTDSIYNDKVIVLKLDSLGQFSFTGINEDVKIPIWHISPNPTSEEIHLDGEIQNQVFTLFDIHGRIQLETENARINVLNLKAGVYTLTATHKLTGNHLGSKKVVILPK